MRVLQNDAIDVAWLTKACQLAGRCPASDSAFSVGAVIVGPDGEELATGHSRETDPVVHAEESALAKLGGPVNQVVPLPLVGATLYSSLEPCTRRRSRPRPCTDLILDSGITRVVFAWREPSTFVENGEAVERLTAARIAVVQLEQLESLARRPNTHLTQSS